MAAIRIRLLEYSGQKGHLDRWPPCPTSKLRKCKHPFCTTSTVQVQSWCGSCSHLRAHIRNPVLFDDNHSFLTIFVAKAIASVLTALPLWAQICAQFFFELRWRFVTFQIPIRSPSWRHQNLAELFSFNFAISHSNEARRIDELSRGSVLGYEILTFS